MIDNGILLFILQEIVIKRSHVLLLHGVERGAQLLVGHAEKLGCLGKLLVGRIFR